MTRQEQLIVIACEEAGELIQALSKTARFGTDKSAWPENNNVNTNAYNVMREFTDLAVILGMLESDGLFQGVDMPENFEEKKRAIVEKHLETSQRLGLMQ